MVSLFARLAITILIIVNVCSRTTEDHNDLRLPQLAEAALKCASSPASPLAKPIDVIAFYNAKSGDQLGKTLAKHFASLIGFESVHDLTQLKSARNICKAVIQAQNQWQKRRVQQKQHPMQPQLQSVDVQSDSEDEADLPRIKAKTLELNPELELNSEPDSDSDADESNHPTAPNSQPATAVDTRQPNAGNYQFILVAGGDGTVQWVQSSLVFCKQHYAKQFKQQFGFTEFPPVVPLPLGTGNDMSSSCGWGSTFPLPPLLAVLRGKGGGLFNRQNSIRQQIKQRLCHIATQSRLIPFDMWNLQYTTQQARPSKIVPLYPVPAALHINKRDTKLRTHMSNYISFGSEADVTRGFQNAREQSPTWHKSRLSNKRSYLLAGMRNLFKRSRPVQKMLTIEIQKRDSFGRPGQQWFSLSNLPANHKTVLISNLPKLVKCNASTCDSIEPRLILKSNRVRPAHRFFVVLSRTDG